MTKAYLAGFIAGMNGKGWDSIPFKDVYSNCSRDWRVGYGDAAFIASGDESVAAEKVGE